MLDIKITKDAHGHEVLETPIHGKALLTIPQLNKGTAFTIEERHAFGLIGKLPSRVETLEEQIARAYQQYHAFDEQINRNVYLNYLLNNNHILFYRLVKAHIKEMLPTIYTPIVGNAVMAFNKKFMQPRGLYISYEDQDHIEEILANRTNPDVKLIVVSDGEGVLGIGDQGVGGMAIPIAKLMVYTAFAGINPLNTLPILLDAGTNNQELLNDPLYLGLRHPRITGKAYDAFIDKFVSAVKKTFPHVFLHWEDFGRTNAYQNLVSYRDKICSFNDDIQGTGVVATAAVLAAVKRTGENIKDQRIVIFGAGTAGMGVAEAIRKALVRSGLSEKEAHDCFWLVDRFGLIQKDSAELTAAQKDYAHRTDEIKTWDVKDQNHITLYETIKHVKPTILIGCSAQSGAFTKAVVEEMARHVERPIIFPLSNPNEKSEAIPRDLLNWTEGKALIATGSPFDDVDYQGETFPISQCNNYLAFPGIGLGLISCQSKVLNDAMLWKASQALGEFTTDPKLLLPSIEQAEGGSIAIATAICETAFEEGLAQVEKPASCERLVKQHIWTPHYLPYQRV